MSHRRVITIAGAAVVLALVAGILAWRWWPDEATRLESAVTGAPAAERYAWTDWAAVRRSADMELTATSPANDVEELLSRGFDADLVSTSALGESAAVMQTDFGFSPATADWELLSQGEKTSSITLRLTDVVDFDDVTDNLRSLEYAEPSTAEGTWSTDSATAPITARVTPELAFVALDVERRLVFASSSAAGVDVARDAAAAEDNHPVPDGVLAALGDAATAVVYTGAQACSELAMGHADAGEQATADALVAAAGPVDPMTGYGFGLTASGALTAALSFEDDERARRNADSRAVLAAGPAPGQGSTFADRFAVEEVVADGSVVTMHLDAVAGAYAFSDLSTGPVLFATC
ncbi:hypothetical protein [Nocardioides sp. R-C-SC26]|uniref:hypothetical protein n=1 Tax=Nocardioides sp. R-C-SC26 TaxID=2870414 RepID=UPI001E3FF84B|nr:hypothetical protein [Nocardioides sp. R-C-SC26]